MMMGCTKRTSRQLLIITAALILLIYLPLNLFYLVFVTPRQSADNTGNKGNNNNNNQLANVAIQISDLQSDEFGNVNVVLSLNIKELLAYLGDEKLRNGEATGNPPPDNVEFVINNPNVCRNSSKIKYIVYVHTSPKNSHRRTLLRQTWTSRTLFSERIIERVFLMGRTDEANLQAKIQAESDRHGDIIQGDFADNYRNLTLKALMGLKWVSTYCRQAEFAIKADDDAFVNIFNLLRLLERHRGKKRLLACPLWGDNSMPILRDPSKCAKWCVKYNEFPGRRYFPKYCAGLTFVLSVDLVQLLYKASKTTPFFWIDDVYVTGILPMKVKDVEYVSLIKNFTLKPEEAMAQLKNVNKSLTHLFVHAKKPEGFLPMWQQLLNRLPLDDIRLLSTDTIEQVPALKKAISPGAKGKN